jgi:hypothetical protein
VSSRQEEKEQRKRERLEREQAEAKTAQRRRLLQIVGGVAVGVAIVVAAVLVIAGGGKDKARDPGVLAADAKRAGCVVRSFPEEGRNHVTKKLTPADFKTNPPTSGNHNPNPAQDGVYAPGNEPPLENWVHTLEHGRIIFTYKPATPKGRIGQLQRLFDEPVLGKNAYHSVLMENNTGMPFEVAGVAWRHYVGCKTFTAESIAALRAFRDVYVDTAPEQIP